MKTVTIDGVEHKDACDKCGKRQYMHSVGPEALCCRCFVLAGHPPADWHSVCMATERELMLKRAGEIAGELTANANT